MSYFYVHHERRAGHKTRADLQRMKHYIDTILNVQLRRHRDILVIHQPSSQTDFVVTRSVLLTFNETQRTIVLQNQVHKQLIINNIHRDNVSNVQYVLDVFKQYYEEIDYFRYVRQISEVININIEPQLLSAQLEKINHNLNDVNKLC